MPCSYVLYQCFHIIKIIIVAVYALPVINHSIFLIPFKAVQKFILTISSGELCKSIGLDLTQQSFSARFTTFVALRNIFCDGTFSVLTPVFIWTFTRITASAGYIFRTQAAGKSTSRDSKFSLNRGTSKTPTSRCKYFHFN